MKRFWNSVAFWFLVCVLEVAALAVAFAVVMGAKP